MKLVGSKAAIRSPEFHKTKVLKRWLIIITLSLALLVVTVGPVLLLRSQKLRVSGVSITGNIVTKDEDMEAIVAKDLSGNYLHVIPRDSILFFLKNEIKDDLLSALPRLTSVRISLSSAHSIGIAVVERQPHALYCAGACFFVDDTGYIFAPAPDFSDAVYMKYATSPALDTPLRTQLFQTDEFKKLEKFVNSLKSLGLGPEVLTRQGDEYDLSERTGPVIKWKASQDLDTLFVNLNSFITNSGLKMADIETMQYIDLRFDNKVFYK